MKLRSRACVLLIAGSLVGCGGSSKSAPSDAGIARPAGPFVSGSRLKAQFYDGGDGALVFIGWQDTLLGVPCTFASAEDDVWRCLPASASEEGYIDAQCTQPLFVLAPCGSTPPKYMTVATNDEVCTAASLGVPQQAGAVYAVGSAVDEATYVRQPGGCSASGMMLTYAMGSHVAPTTFVAANLSILPLTDGLSELLLTAADGATQYFAPYDTQWATACRMDPVAGSCLPGFFASTFPADPDAGCSSPVLQGYLPWCGSPPLSVEYDFSGGDDAGPCDPALPAMTVSVTAVGPPIAASIGAACTMTAPTDPPSASFYAAGASVPVDSFTPIATALTGTGRLRAYENTTPHGDYVGNFGTASFHDEQLGVDCNPALAADGATRCFPTEILYGAAFSDPACATPLISNGSCASPPEGYVITRAATCDEAVTVVNGVGPAYDGPVYLANPTGTCTLLEASSSLGASYWQFGNPIPLSTFAPVTIATR